MFTITADVGYQTKEVVVDGVSFVASVAYIFKNVTADHTISAIFTSSSL